MQLAVVAHENHVPVYAVVPTSTIDLQLSSGKEIPIEIRDKMEVICVDGAIVAPIDSEVYNPAFDVTPHQYITAIITEKGICYPPFSESLKKIVTACFVFSKVQFVLGMMLKIVLLEIRVKGRI